MHTGVALPAGFTWICGCSGTHRVEDVTGVWEKYMVGQLLLAETAATLPVVSILMALSSSPGLVMFLGVLSGVLCLVMPFNYAGGTDAMASSRPGVTFQMYPMTQMASRRCAVSVARCLSIASTVQRHGLVSTCRCSSTPHGVPCCVVSPRTSGSLEPYLVLGCKAYR